MAKYSKEFLEKQKNERVGMVNYNKSGELMTVIEYQDSHHVIIEFNDELHNKATVYWKSFIDGAVRNPINYNEFDYRLGMEKLNKNGELMKIIKYNNRHDIIVEFQDVYKFQVHTDWTSFKNSSVKNPGYPCVAGVGIVGNKYPTTKNGKLIKEYYTWVQMLRRCYDENYKTNTYQYSTCCKEWLYYPNFYEWLHEQENFNTWINLDRSALDKDIVIKGNKLYSPDTCSIVPYEINSLFVKRDASRGNLPIGVVFYKPLNKYKSECNNSSVNIHLGYYDTIEAAFQSYKKYKENLIKQIAKKEFENGNISKRCYQSMLHYNVEITD